MITNRTTLGLVVLGSMLFGGLVTQHLVEQQSREQTVLAAQQLLMHWCGALCCSSQLGTNSAADAVGADHQSQSACAIVRFRSL